MTPEFYRRMGITPPAEIPVVPRPEQVWQLVGMEPHVAVLAFDEADARAKIEAIVPGVGSIVRIK